ncbi:MAG: CaiB/BaiF CoA-transferase family protein [Thermodesulfobacteriota bacterium]
MAIGALEGVKVIDLTGLLPGQFCSGMLADHGADVVVVEAPRFKNDSVIGEIPMVRRNKRHLALDLKSAEGKEVFFRLVSRADVCIEGFRPGVAQRLGVGYEQVSGENPRIVYCSLTGYGQTGPLAKRAGHDLNYMAFAGMLDLSRDNLGVPVVPNFQMAGLSGSLYAVIGILMALLSRPATGLGQHVDVSITDGLVSLLPLPLTAAFSGNSLPGRADSTGRDRFPCYDVYQTRDNEFLSVGPLEPHLWVSLCNKLGFPQYASLQYDPNSRDEIASALRRLFLTRDLDDWLEFLSSDDDCVAPVRRVTDLARDPHLQARDMLPIAGGGIPQPGVAPKLMGTPGAVRRPAYRFGEHSREILEELGYSPERIEELRSKGVVLVAT